MYCHHLKTKSRQDCKTKTWIHWEEEEWSIRVFSLNANRFIWLQSHVMLLGCLRVKMNDLFQQYSLWCCLQHPLHLQLVLTDSHISLTLPTFVDPVNEQARGNSTLHRWHLSACCLLCKCYIWEFKWVIERKLYWVVQCRFTPTRWQHCAKYNDSDFRGLLVIWGKWQRSDSLLTMFVDYKFHIL